MRCRRSELSVTRSAARAQSTAWWGFVSLRPRAAVTAVRFQDFFTRGGNPVPRPRSHSRLWPARGAVHVLLGVGVGGVGPDGSPGPDTASPVGAASPGAFPSGAGLRGQRARAVLPGASPSSCCRLSPMSAAFSGASQEHCRVGGSVLRTCGAARWPVPHTRSSSCSFASRLSPETGGRPLRSAAGPRRRSVLRAGGPAGPAGLFALASRP